MYGRMQGHIAIDGKTLKGRRRLDAKAIHVLSAFSTELGAVIGDLVVATDKNEISAALVLLKGLPLAGAIITGDAIFTQCEICRHIIPAAIISDSRAATASRSARRHGRRRL
jgi:hypothetical protein